MKTNCSNLALSYSASSVLFSITKATNPEWREPKTVSLLARPIQVKVLEYILTTIHTIKVFTIRFQPWLWIKKGFFFTTWKEQGIHKIKPKEATKITGNKQKREITVWKTAFKCFSYRSFWPTPILIANLDNQWKQKWLTTFAIIKNRVYAVPVNLI